MMFRSSSSSSSSAFSTHHDQVADDEISDRLHYHTKLNIKRQLKELGYTSDVPDDVLQEFIESMQEKNEKVASQHTDYSIDRLDRGFHGNESMSGDGVRGMSEGETSKVMQRLKKIDLNPLRSNIQQHVHRDPSSSHSIHSHSPQHSTYSRSPSPTTITPRTTTKPRSLSSKPKKHDPVNRIHELKRIWNADAFLKRTGDLNANPGRALVQSKISLGASTSSLKSTKKPAARI